MQSICVLATLQATERDTGLPPGIALPGPCIPFHATTMGRGREKQKREEEKKNKNKTSRFPGHHAYTLSA